jgi:THO complex subunit 1 transcription elongation factor
MVSDLQAFNVVCSPRLCPCCVHTPAHQHVSLLYAGKHHMLRTCNQLLRRLSKGHNAVLCGRILIFLARLLPLSDRSGINLQVLPARLVPLGALSMQAGGHVIVSIAWQSRPGVEPA